MYNLGMLCVRTWNVHLLFIVGLKWCLKLTYQKENNNN